MEKSAYERLTGLEQSTADQIRKFKVHVSQMDQELADLKAKADLLILAGNDPTKIEGEMEALKKKQASLNQRIVVLNSAHESDIYRDAAKQAIDENAELMKAVHVEWCGAVEKLKSVFNEYLKVVATIKPLEMQSSRLWSQREYCYSFLPKGTTFVYAKGVETPVELNRQKGPIFICMDHLKIKDAYLKGEKPQPEIERIN